MQTFKAVEANRRRYHQDGMRNSVHRSSLLVPAFAGSRASVSFLNHFLVKRGYPEVGCRLTAIDGDGRRIDSLLSLVDEPRVYDVPLSGMFGDEAATWLVEFFASRNLYIPFPAAMVNHYGDNFANAVHSFNRVLNDVFEDDGIGAATTAETFIEVRNDAVGQSFVDFCAGTARCTGALGFELATADGRRFAGTVVLDQPRLTHRRIALREAIPDAPAGVGGTLVVRQPRQPMFFGRLFSGVLATDGAFSANHSYYSAGGRAEYWENREPGYRTYPFFPEIENVVRLFPVYAAGTLEIELAVAAPDGRPLGRFAAGRVTSPGSAPLDIPINGRLAAAGVDPADVGAFTVLARPVDGNTPTRIAHQLVHADPAGRGIASSVPVGLFSRNVFVPEGKRGFSWGQVLTNPGTTSWLGICGGPYDRAEADLHLDFYGTGGLIESRQLALPAGGVARFRYPDELPAVAAAAGASPVWYVARSRSPELTGYVATRCEASGHLTAEHSF